MTPYLVVKLAGKPYGVNFQEIEEIQHAKKGTPMPFAEPWHEGMITVRGSLYTVLNIRRMLNLSLLDVPEQDKMILLSRHKVAILAEEFDDTLMVEETDIRENDGEQALDTAVFPTLAASGESMIPLLDIDALLALSKAEA
ncbi:chemotaxis protein CheW [Paenibacillus sp. P96]|uniref:Chemotaxis protein CheW n=1 Tax=Paenibacillus zeirhizosphaerae TaxID=2987519 RepID=A0ABT9FTD6_9BACL|nr:chemotaxis protein CheW [Paenibacillus sp. P96]MDP4097997.1 chemotaxis protein CheW [Paenibacillus sp. P96]